ncbi:MAG: hypothetical protein CMO41_04480 [Verrucomicrobiales bacterium]|nr:hypothetical protein [Verrucomicrobiales bacterium]|tara:strand:- start:11231 stop:11542 length:312 start_codon:yes stop_codon:yes gene_type:complete
MSTVGAFLREKLKNMATWLENEGVSGAAVSHLQEVQIVAMAQHLHDNYAEALTQRAFTPLLQDKENIPLIVLKIIKEVEARVDLHDKFWRYLELFSKTVGNHE